MTKSREINKIRENPVRHAQIAAKNTAGEAGMINDDCAFSLQKPVFFFVLILIIFFILTVSV